jgi:hypothetical protein
MDGYHTLLDPNYGWDKIKINYVPKYKPTFEELDTGNHPVNLKMYVSTLYMYYARQVADSWVDESHTLHNLLAAEQVVVWRNILDDLKALSDNREDLSELTTKEILIVRAEIEELLM